MEGLNGKKEECQLQRCCDGLFYFRLHFTIVGVVVVVVVGVVGVVGVVVGVGVAVNASSNKTGFSSYLEMKRAQKS